MSKTEAGPVAQDWLKARIDEEMAEYSAGAYADHGSARDQLALFAADLMLAAHPPAQEPVPAVGWTGNADADLALILLDRLDVTVEDTARVDQLEGLVRKLAATHPTPAERATLKGQP
jgi:hypothetical protein